ncbi:hypothetical protein [Streptomyces sp. NPDC059909]|uniref:hypothetical protein n=1 Tax=Streptomyces sp. NPDC059909 TaxID=3346998 RepID=UPI00366598DB
MTQTPAQTPLDAVRVPPAPRLGQGRRLLRALAIVSCAPYISLKIAWVAGSEIGIPEGSGLLDHRVQMAVVNSITVLMDAAVVVLALLLTQPWGLRVRSWLLAFPMWVATGLLVPIMVGFPLQLLVALGGGTTAQDAPKEPFLDEWVFGVVYSGFIVQGLTLGTLFVLYARGRWGHLWHGTVWDLPTAVTGPRMRATTLAGSVLALFPAVMHLLWAAGSTAGLSPAGLDQRTTDFYVLEGVRVLFVVLAVTGVLLLAFRRGPQLRVRTPLALGWVGSGVMGAWGGFMLLVTLMPEADPDKAATALMTLTYAGEMITGLLLATGIASFLRRRGA